MIEISVFWQKINRRGHRGHRVFFSERESFNRLFPLRVTLRTLRLNSRFGYSSPHVPGSSCIVKSLDSGFKYLSSYVPASIGV
ncbi:MAG: hypothetical protein C5S48_04520 [Candidatus Methanogaster sp.]|nr:MAG: hypothetical protein C5S48_04520 [ANME-2 cluster archaeon]